MFRGRILLVSDRKEVIAELDPLIRAEGHLTLTVPNGDEAFHVFEEGIIPDVVVSDSGSSNPRPGSLYLRRFRQLNQLGQHLVIMDGGKWEAELDSTSGPLASPDPLHPLHRPFREDQVREAVREAMERIRRDLESLRGEMFREAARLQQAIREAQLEMVTALALTMEAKDPYMRGHCERVAKLARKVAAELDLDEEAIELLGTAAVLHEIGKIGVSLELLHKSGTLSSTELKQVRAHPQVGAQIVSAVPSLRRIAPLIENQYTDYAKLREIIDPETPEFLLAGILRVVDTYDAMTSERSYRNVLSRERWEGALREGSGTLFHPDALATFFRLEARGGLGS